MFKSFSSEFFKVVFVFDKVWNKIKVFNNVIKLNLLKIICSQISNPQTQINTSYTNIVNNPPSSVWNIFEADICKQSKYFFSLNFFHQNLWTNCFESILKNSSETIGNFFNSYNFNKKYFLKYQLNIYNRILNF